MTAASSFVPNFSGRVECIMSTPTPALGLHMPGVALRGVGRLRDCPVGSS